MPRTPAGGTPRGVDRLFADLVAFYEEHRCCGELKSGIEDDGTGKRARMTCSCSACISRLVEGSTEEPMH